MKQRRGFIIISSVLAVASLAAIVAPWGEEREDGHALAGIPLHQVEGAVFRRTVNADGLLEAVQATPMTVPVDAPGMLRIAWLAPDGAPLEENEIAVRFDPTDLERDLADGRANLAIAELRIKRALHENSTEKGNLLLDASVAEKELEQAERYASADETIFSRHEILDSEIDRELAGQRASNARSRSETVEKQGLTELDLLEIEKSKAELEIRKAEKGLASLEVRAPHAGMLVLQRNWRGERARPGDQVWPGQKLAEFPDPSKMKVRAYVLEADAAGLEAGLEAQITVEAYPGSSYAARVDRVDALAKKRHHNVPVQYFQATLIPEETDQQTMKPGQRVRGEILLDEQDSALVVPLQTVFRIDKVDTVFLRRGSRLIPVPVVLGPRSISRVQVVEGLSEGDVIALSDPRQGASESLDAASDFGAGAFGPLAGGAP